MQFCGSGFNHIFPDREVFDKILENDGAIITEYEPDVEVFPQGFRDRNRIVAGLSVGTLVVEAREKSGTGITAEFVKRFKRELFCIPHQIWDEHGEGTNRWLKNGAKLVTEIEDILPYFKQIKEIKGKTKDVIKELEIEMPEEYRNIYNAIDNEITSDELSKKLQMDISNINTILTMLELEGYIERLPGNYFKKGRM